LNIDQHTAGYVYDTGRVYEHHKGRLYRIVGLAPHTETGEELVVYRAMYGDQGMWARPRSMFEETVTVAEGRRVPRFTLADRQKTAPGPVAESSQAASAAPKEI
jgi:hypothetical protein